MILLVLILGIGFIIWSVIFGAWYVPSVPWAVRKMISLLDIKKGERAVDLGSGDGRVVLALAQKGAIARGYEVNPFAYLYSLYIIKKARVQEGSAKIYFRSFWGVDLSDYTVVTVFLAPHLMKKIEKKLQKELPKGARVITQTFKFPTWKPITHDDSFYVYRKE